MTSERVKDYATTPVNQLPVHNFCNRIVSSTVMYRRSFFSPRNLCLFAILDFTPQFFTHMETSPLPVKGYEQN